MALPALKTIQDCADYSKIVEPYLPQLKELPWQVVDTVKNGESLLLLYQKTNPFISGLAISISLGFVFWAVSEINRNYSQVDRCWSVLPMLYVAHFAGWSHLNGLPSQRLDICLLWSFVWSARLTFNYWRKGGYEIGAEDYRWEIIRSKIHPAVFFVFNATFIAFVQSVLLYLMAAPTYIILLSTKFEQDIQPGDYFFTAVQLGLVLSEWFSDGQQWDYQNAKKEYRKTAKVPRDCGFTQEDLDRGFITNRLWAYSRHPNFAAEQTIWFILYQWSCYSAKVLYSWGGVGSWFLIALFQGSTWLTELITSGKYTDYKHYQSQTPMFVPGFKAYKADKSKSKQR